MQSQGLIMLLFILFIVPVIMLFANPNIFFIIVSLVLIITSLRNIHIVLFDIYDDKDSESEEELLEDLEVSLNIDMRKLGKGIKVVLDLIFILFFIYSVFYINSIWIKALFGIIIFYRCTDIIQMLDDRLIVTEIISMAKRMNTVIVLTNSATIILITIVFCNKFFMGRI